MKIALTGIKPTGIPHLGNYLGAIKPALKLAEEFQSLYFIADYHALNSIHDAKLLQEYTYKIAATWLACGLNPEKVLFYRQSDIPEIFELTSILNNFTNKGLMNRSHAYKASVQNNIESNNDTDYNINMGLFSYPILMAADILLFDTEIVPVGKDQKQHVEIARDIAKALNHIYNKQLLTIPEAYIEENSNTIIGLDGRKMSKTYNNTIPLFESEKILRKTIMKIVTNSQGVEEKKDPDKSYIFQLYKLFTLEEQQKQLAKRYRSGGMGWGEAKQALFEVIHAELTSYTKKYDLFMNDKKLIDTILAEGAKKARIKAKKKISFIKKTLGITLI